MCLRPVEGSPAPGSPHRLSRSPGAAAASQGRSWRSCGALPRIVTLHNVSIKQQQNAAPDQLQLDVTAKTYRYLDDNEIAAVEAARKANAATTRGSSSS